MIKLNTNENPYPPSPRVLEAIAGTADASVRLYPDPEAHALRARAARVYGVPADHIMAGNGSDELLALVLRATIDPGDRVAFPVPTYSLYETLVAVQGGAAVRVPFPDDFSLPPALAAARARVTFLCNPNSPSGTLVPLERVEALARALPGPLVVDEAYVDFAREHALGLVGRLPNVLVLRTNLSRLSQAAGEAALGDLPWMEANLARIKATRARLAAELERTGFRVPASEANFVLARQPGVDLGPVARALAARDILVRHFAVPGLEDALRITVGTDAEVDALLAALRDVARP